MAERFGILCSSGMWTAASRTASALTRHGADICIIAPKDSIVTKTKFKAADILLDPEDMQRKLPAVLRTLAEDFDAHSILAGDDLAFGMLAKLVEHADRIELSPVTRTLLERSMPNAAAARLIARDSDFIAAQDHRPCPPPPQIRGPSKDEAAAFAARVGYPVVVKRDGFTSGQGVTVCENEERLGATLARAAETSFVVQKFITGPTYGVTVSGIKGRAMAGFSFVKHCVGSRFGATSVARFDQRSDMIEQAKTVFEEYGLNGYAGFDYMVDADGRAYFIEINPRIMPTGHFTECFGIDLTAAFLAGVRNEPTPAARAVRDEYVAMFPGEWMRDASSPYLREAYHDVPWEDPPILAAMIDRALKMQTRTTVEGFMGF